MIKKMRWMAIMIVLFCKAEASTAQFDSIVKANRVKYQQVRNKQPEYEQVKTTFTESTGSVQATAFYEGNDLMIIEVIHFSEGIHKQTEYYFENGYLYFALERAQPPENVITINSKGKDKGKTRLSSAANTAVTENRYYFYGDKLIRWYDNEQQVVDLNAGTNSTVGNGLVTEAYKMKERLKK